jgi:hypothetical protein
MEPDRRPRAARRAFRLRVRPRTRHARGRRIRARPREQGGPVRPVRHPRRRWVRRRVCRPPGPGATRSPGPGDFLVRSGRRWWGLRWSRRLWFGRRCTRLRRGIGNDIALGVSSRGERRARNEEYEEGDCRRWKASWPPHPRVQESRHHRFVRLLPRHEFRGRAMRPDFRPISSNYSSEASARSPLEGSGRTRPARGFVASFQIYRRCRGSEETPRGTSLRPSQGPDPGERG